ncbi:putative RNA-directed DNA polymerase from transposon BS [Amphibalanus amphitrite]|uniref:Putative RNA-directed DNA polymerase from transposon BS n=1 Tax=Amphibalanus amphitrite TaxID=1232801 RepID=A0A6A4V3Y4_AMPAM|nr:putative RNA-directed DNA polymerase from transposon BS [Amphibalanus amphitrite]
MNEGLPEGVSRSLFADDVALLADARTPEECDAHLQPCLDSIGAWLTRWKVTPSVSKCTSTLFSLDPKQQRGRVRPNLKLHGQEITATEHPTFLGIKFDPQLTFAEHVSDLKAKMARRRRCLQAMAGKTWGSHRRTLRTAYIGYVRALFDYGAAVVGTHAAPSVRERLEAEQNKCARLITGCIRLTRTDALLAEADLPPLSLRAKQLAGQECQRLARLPALDPARTLLEKEVRPRLEYRAHLAWRRDCTQAEAARRPPPKPPDEDAVLTKKPCLRRQLQRGPAGQVTALAADIWECLHTLSERGTTVTFQWVPGHAGLDGNEHADQLAGEAAAAEQPDVQIDFASARSAIGRRVGTMVDARTRASHPHPAPTPGHNDLSRWEACTLSQLRTGASPLTRDVAHRLGLAVDAACPACGEPDSAAHLLTDCPAYEAARRRRWGLNPSLGDVLGGPAPLVIEFIRAVGRTDPPVDPPAPSSP